ncbi:hypothetical protein Tco_0835138 [Tanacetum coccineum]
MGHSTYGCRRVSEMDSYIEVAEQGQAAPPSPSYVPDHMELDHHVPVYIQSLCTRSTWFHLMMISLLRIWRRNPIDLCCRCLMIDERISSRIRIMRGIAPSTCLTLHLLHLLQLFDHVPYTSVDETETFKTRFLPEIERDHDALCDEVDTLRRYLSSLCTTHEQERVRAHQALDRSEAHNKALEARIAVLETQAYRHEWQHQDADDHATRSIMRI